MTSRPFVPESDGSARALDWTTGTLTVTWPRLVDLQEQVIFSDLNHNYNKLMQVHGTGMHNLRNDGSVRGVDDTVFLPYLSQMTASTMKSAYNTQILLIYDALDDAE